jgi:hypothetical protein
MQELKRLPSAIETALSEAFTEIRLIGGDELTLRALVQNTMTALEARGYEARPGFKLGITGVLDLSGRDKVAELRERSGVEVVTG